MYDYDTTQQCNKKQLRHEYMMSRPTRQSQHKMYMMPSTKGWGRKPKHKNINMKNKTTSVRASASARNFLM